LFDSCSNEDFIGPKCSSKISRSKVCFFCRKSVSNQGPIMDCDFCPLTYHIHCLKTRHHLLNSNQWICPNHFDQYRMTNTHSQQRVRIFEKSSRISSNIIRQDFKKKSKSLKTIANKQFEYKEISQIPLAIKQFYSTSDQIPISKSIDDISSSSSSSTTTTSSSSSFVYDPTVWDVLQSILDDTTHARTYEFSPFIETQPMNETKTNPYDTMDYLIGKLNQPNSSLDSILVKTIS